MTKHNIGSLVRKYYELKKLTPEEQAAALREILRSDIAHWWDIYEHGCNDPAWPDGTNLNLVRMHIIREVQNLKKLGEDVSGVHIPPAVDEELMIPHGEYFESRSKWLKQQGHRVRVADTETSLF